MPADLHVHTSASDGSFSPTEVVRQALALGLQAIAITDHDTVAGVEEARQAAAGSSLELVPGVELSCEDKERDIHILGYYPRFEAAFLARLDELACARRERIARIVTKLKALGIDIDFADVEAQTGTGTLGRPHVAAALVAAGLAGSVQDAFARFLTRGAPAYVPQPKFHPAEAVGFILQCGGVPVLAHPGLIGDDTVISKLVAAGLAGIEVYHPDHDRAAQSRYLAVARGHGLVVTGGSDFHGGGHHAPLGEVTVSNDAVQALRLLCKSKKGPSNIK